MTSSLAPAKRYRINEDDCIPWSMSCGSHSYGQIRINGRLHLAHRLALEEKIGRKLQPGEQACHTCDNPSCVNPRHLFLGNARLNALDCVAKGRANRASKKSGTWRGGGRSRGAMSTVEREARSKVNLQAARVMRHFVGRRGFGRLLAGLFGVSPQTVCNIQKGRNLYE